MFMTCSSRKQSDRMSDSEQNNGSDRNQAAKASMDSEGVLASYKAMWAVSARSCSCVKEISLSHVKPEAMQLPLRPIVKGTILCRYHRPME